MQGAEGEEEMKKFLAVFVLIMLCAFSAFSKQVTADGFGSTARLAEQDALRNAVESAMGTVVDSHTLSEEHLLIEDRVLTHSRGYITDYKVQENKKIRDGWQVRILADVDTEADSKLMNDLVKLGIVDLSLRNPRIGVLVFEENWTDDSIPAETAMVKSFIDNGFDQVLNTDDFVMYRRDAWRYDIAKLRMLAAKMNADILVVGKAVHNFNGDVGRFINDRHKKTGMLSCRAEVDVRMYSAKTGRIIASESKIGNGVDISKKIAIRTAVNNAASQAASVLADKLIAEGAGNRQYISLTAQVADFHKLEVLRKALEQIEQVKFVELRNYEKGEGLFQIRYASSPEQLFERLQRKAECRVILKSVGYDGLVIKAY